MVKSIYIKPSKRKSDGYRCFDIYDNEWKLVQDKSIDIIKVEGINVELDITDKGLVRIFAREEITTENNGCTFTIKKKAEPKTLTDDITDVDRYFEKMLNDKRPFLLPMPEERPTYEELLIANQKLIEMLYEERKRK